MAKSLLIITQKVDADDQLLGFFIPWLEHFAQKFESILVFCLQKGEYVLPSNISVVSLGKDRGKGKLKQLFTFYFLLFTLRKKYDAVFVHMNPIWVVIGASLWHRLGKKVFFWYTHKAVTARLRLAEKLADVIFTASPESFRVPSKKVVVTGHGIDTELFRPDPTVRRPPMTLLSVGRIAPVKNYEVLIDAVNVLADEGFNCTVTIVGEPALQSDATYYEKLISKINNLGLGGVISFVGKKQNKALVEQYQSHELFVHMSKTGSLDKTILEAMACGMKVISSNDASRGFLPSSLIFDGDDAFSLAKAIRYALEQSATPELRQYVVWHHNLDTLIHTLSDEMTK